MLKAIPTPGHHEDLTAEKEKKLTDYTKRHQIQVPFSFDLLRQSARDPLVHPTGTAISTTENGTPFT
jgi:hypothetical protein